ncbi:MAG TPA: sulfite exporter TauE/SafE family protein, partial [Syntrophorhabdaceae bacterium]|nr:sulfite exporter TauE/SafE family protein [Syntrophorhabdaceae bacterium]
ITVRFGAIFAHSLPERKLKKSFGIFLFFVTLLLISKGYIFQTTVNTNLWLRIFIFLTTGAFTGFISGMMGVGGGAIMIPPMVILTHMPQQMAQGTSLLAMVPVGLIGAYTHYKLGNVEKSIAPGLVIGAALGGFFGGTVANLIPEFYLKLLFSMVLLWMSIRFIKIAR